MIGEEAGDQVRANVSASFVKTECAGNIPGADEKRPVTPPVVRLQKFERLSSVSFPLILEGYSQILDLSVGQQEQVEEAFFVRGDFFESQRYDGRVFLSGWGT